MKIWRQGLTSGVRVHIIGERSARRCFLWVKKIGRIRSRACSTSSARCSPSCIKGIWTYGAFVIAAIVGLEAMVKRNFLLFLIFAALLVVCVIFIFFPGTYESLLNFLPSK